MDRGEDEEDDEYGDGEGENVDSSADEDIEEEECGAGTDKEEVDPSAGKNDSLRGCGPGVPAFPVDVDGNGDADLESGRGMVEGSTSSASTLTEVEPVLTLALDFFPASLAAETFFAAGAGEFELDDDDGGGGGGVSCTQGKPICGPRKFRMEEKCSQSWYLRICSASIVEG